MSEPAVLPPYMALQLRLKKEDVAIRVSDGHLQKALGYELFALEQMFKEAETKQSLELAKKALSYAQDVMYMADQYPARKMRSPQN